MIRYRLQCKKGHEFEAWFNSSKAYDTQAKRGLVECPDCGSKKVTKALMAPGVATRGRNRGREEAPAPQPEAASTGEVVQQAPANAEALARIEMQRQFVEVMRHIRKEVESKAEYVGPRFAEEARKIHHKESEARGIWGEATPKEAHDLVEDGIDCLPLPRLPEDNN
jgi:hypothetical protein